MWGTVVTEEQRSGGITTSTEGDSPLMSLRDILEVKPIHNKVWQFNSGGGNNDRVWDEVY